MKNTFKLFAIITMAAVIVFSMASCNLDPGDDGVAKTLVITGIPSTLDGTTITNKQITVALCNNDKKGDPQIFALNQADSKDTVTVPLLSGNENKKGDVFTGTGDYYIFLFFDVNDTKSDLKDDTTYAYGGGGNVPVKYTIAKGQATSTIPWAQFRKLD